MKNIINVAKGLIPFTSDAITPRNVFISINRSKIASDIIKNFSAKYYPILSFIMSKIKKNEKITNDYLIYVEHTMFVFSIITFDSDPIEIECPSCEGTGGFYETEREKQIDCDACGGNGEIRGDRCEKCKGTGVKTCTYCGGSGDISTNGEFIPYAITGYVSLDEKLRDMINVMTLDEIEINNDIEQIVLESELTFPVCDKIFNPGEGFTRYINARYSDSKYFGVIIHNPEFKWEESPVYGHSEINPIGFSFLPENFTD